MSILSAMSAFSDTTENLLNYNQIDVKHLRLFIQVMLRFAIDSILLYSTAFTRLLYCLGNYCVDLAIQICDF